MVYSITIAAASAAVCLNVAAADSNPQGAEERRFPQTHISVPQWREFYREAQAKPSAVIVDRQQITQVVVTRERAVYLFTKPTHPAHPAAVRRSIVSYGEKTYLHTSGYYAGDYAAFTAWLKLFRARDRQLQRHLEDRSKQRIGRVLFVYSII